MLEVYGAGVEGGAWEGHERLQAKGSERKINIGVRDTCHNTHHP